MGDARIGPNALTQLFGPIERRIGHDGLQRMLAAACAPEAPDMTGLMDEAPVIRLHAKVHCDLSEEADAIEREAGMGTAEYVIAHRIPRLAKTVLRHLPTELSRQLLATAIRKNAWTFAGSGSFRIASRRPLVFQITDNPLARDMRAHLPVCAWHTAVVQTLFRRLADPDAVVTETTCCAMGHSACTFIVSRE